MSKHLAVLILAAGSSSRLGETTKQLIKYKNQSLLRLTVKKALEISDDVFVVLGHKFDECLAEIKDLDIKVLNNESYKKGMGTSISFGISHMEHYENTMILLCDQPFIPYSHLNKLKNLINNKNIIATQYEDNTFLTVPAIFPSIYYPKLKQLKKDKGAKSILKNEECLKLELSKENSVDIDTKEDIISYLSVFCLQL